MLKYLLVSVTAAPLVLHNLLLLVGDLKILTLIRVRVVLWHLVHHFVHIWLDFNVASELLPIIQQCVAGVIVTY